MIAAEVIRRKRDGVELDDVEITQFFTAVSSGAVTDYQASAMLMAIFLKGFSLRETTTLTTVMRNSGAQLDWRSFAKPVVDKHSTGGVGDKTSLVILPLCTLFDVVVPMMSGRGLGHTGGTLDKLESITGMNVFPSVTLARKVVSQFGGVFLGQTEELAPLDRKLYALRDVTATVESIPLITASILSKKLAEGIDSLVMDVKFGSGAFMPTFESAQQLARSLLQVGHSAGLKMTSLVTSMNNALGVNAGNQLEVRECVDIMKGGGPDDTRELCIALTAEMLRLSGRVLDKDDLSEALRSGKVFERFCQIVAAQGGDTSILDDGFTECQFQIDVKAQQSGYVSVIDVRRLGLAILALGGGRKSAEDRVDPLVGLTDICRVGDAVTRGDLLLRVHANDRQKAADAIKILNSNTFEIRDSMPVLQALIKEVIS
jgi:thymidine phosphorylase